MITIKPQSIIYIACPANVATGGTELLHQLCFKLNSNSINAVMYYYDHKDSTSPIHKNFEKYKPTYSAILNDELGNVLIVPEVATALLLKYRKLDKVIWWLSIDNFYLFKLSRIQRNLHRLKLFSRKKLLTSVVKASGVKHHLVQSEYARLHLLSCGIDSMYLSDFLNKKYLDEAQFVSHENRENLIVYYPAKGARFTKKLISSSPDLRWCPIENMSVDEIIALFKRSKVYVDFGHHPGKDRIPREAALMGCVVITSKNGSAANAIDIPIPSTYKFNDNILNRSRIIAKIRLCLSDYETAVKDFKEYRESILREEQKFEEEIKQIFIKE